MARKKLGTLSEQMYYVLLVMREERCGAQPSDTVRSILSKEGVLKRLHEEKNAK